MFFSSQSMLRSTCKLLKTNHLPFNFSRSKHYCIPIGLTTAVTCLTSIIAINFYPSEKFSSSNHDVHEVIGHSEVNIRFLDWAPKVSYCEAHEKKQSNGNESPYSQPSRWRLMLSSLKLYNLPIPRLLSPNDPAFFYPELRRGLKKRQKDEMELAKLEKEAIQAKMSGNVASIAHMVHKISDIAYGKGITPQMRQDFLIKYGCTAYTAEILDFLNELGCEHHIRGIIEIGAGNGQWARALSNHHKKIQTNNQEKLQFEFVMAYDDMSSLPLSPRIYHSKTKPAHDNFYANVRKSNHTQALQSWESRGRVLLIVFPPPGPMAVETAREYVRLDEERNDTVVYVGEGRGGANADEEFFSFFESGEWVLDTVLQVGRDVDGLTGKGFEKLFCFKRISKIREVP